jgi:hypothetical protein
LNENQEEDEGEDGDKPADGEGDVGAANCLKVLGSF